MLRRPGIKPTSFNRSLDILENSLRFFGLVVFDNDRNPLPDKVSHSVIHQMGIVESLLLNIDSKWIFFTTVIYGILGGAGLGYRIVAHLGVDG
jgi:hypothetical protein